MVIKTELGGKIMAKMTYLQEVTEIAKAFCKKFNYEFVFANENKFGYKDSDDQFWTLSYFELADILGGK